MGEESRFRTYVTLDVKDENGTRYREISFQSDGTLHISGQDFGKGVQGVFGTYEYEFERIFNPAEVAALRMLLKLKPEDDLMTAIEARFNETRKLEKFADRGGIQGTFWSRAGD